VISYDYAFRPEGTATKTEALALTYGSGAVCSREAVLHPDPYPGTTWQDGVRFGEVSLGYPEELEIRPGRPRSLRQVFPVEPAVPQGGTTIAVASSA
jgi:hypothetical protein